MDDAAADAQSVADPEPIAQGRRRLSADDARPASFKLSYPHDAAAGPLDPDTCRICRGEATPAEPLFYPCKCSGSIKFVHQDCLMEWLSHSQKKHCELCKTAFRFTKLYDPKMPKALPLLVFASHLAKYIFRNILVWLRAVLVLSVWLAWLPYLMRSVWTGLFWISDDGLGSTRLLFGRLDDTSNVVDAQHPSALATTVCPSSPLFTTTACGTSGAVVGTPTLSAVHLAASQFAANITWADSFAAMVFRFLFGPAGQAEEHAVGFPNATAAQAVAPKAPTIHPSLLSDVGFLRHLTRYTRVNGLVIAILEGQLITILVIVCFILIILVRDYVVQQQPEINVRAGFANADNAPPQPRRAVQADLRDEDIEHLRGPDESDDDETGVPEDTDNPPTPVFGPLPDSELTSELHVQMKLTAELYRQQYRPDGTNRTDTMYARPVAPAPSPVIAPWPFPGSSRRDGDMATETAGGEARLPGSAGLHADAEFGDGEAQESTVHEYLRVYREAGGDVDEIFKIVKEEHLEDRLDYWVERTRIMAERPRLSEAMAKTTKLAREAHESEASSSAARPSGPSDIQSWIVETPYEQDRPLDGAAEDAADARDSDAKGKGTDRNAADKSILMDSPSRPRANTDGPQRPDGASPFANNNWAFSPLPDGQRDESYYKYSHSFEEEWKFDSPPSDDHPTDDGPSDNVPSDNIPSDDVHSDDAPSDTVPSDDEGPSDDDAEPLLGLQPPPAARAAVPDGGASDNLGDFNDLLPPPRPEMIMDVAALDDPPKNLVEWLINFMFREVDINEIRPRMPPLFDDSDDEDGFGDAGHDGDAAEGFDRDREVVEAAVAAGLDPEAMEDAEDLEGVMELLGMRGPITGLFQNALFCVFLVSITIFVGVFLPYNFGRFSVWVLANPMRPVRILFGLSRFLQDIALVLVGGVSGGFFYLIHLCVQLCGVLLGRKLAASTYLASTVFASFDTMDGAARRVFDCFLVEAAIISSEEIRNFSAVSHQALLAVKGQIAFVFAALGQVVIFVLGSDYAEKAAGIRTAMEHLTALAWLAIREAPAMLSSPSSWVITLESSDVVASVDPKLANWDGMDRFWAIAVGYVALCLVAALYLRRGAPFSTGQAGREVEASIMDALNQASGVLKVILIIGIEMLVFPLYCGLLLDAALLPLFEDTTLTSRILFTLNYPLTSIFVHWFVGTGYMFHFALFVSMCRKIMRKGVLCRFCPFPPSQQRVPLSSSHLTLRQTSSATPTIRSSILCATFSNGA